MFIYLEKKVRIMYIDSDEWIWDSLHSQIVKFLFELQKLLIIILPWALTIYNIVMQQPIQSQGLPTDCWPHVHLPADIVERSSSQFRITYGQYVASLMLFLPTPYTGSKNCSLNKNIYSL